MNEASAALVGDWDVYSGPMHSELFLDPAGNYRRLLWGGAQSHWGTWTIEEQNGFTYLVLRLAGANPVVVPGSGGLPMHWPAWEAFQILQMDTNVIVCPMALLRRKVAAPMTQAFVPGNAFFPAGQPGGGFNQFPAPGMGAGFAPPLQSYPPATLQAFAPPPMPQLAPRPPLPDAGPEPLPPKAAPGEQVSDSDMAKWKKEHDDWLAARNLYAQIAADDRKSDLAISDLKAAADTKEYESTQANIGHMNDVIEEGVQQTLKYIKS